MASGKSAHVKVVFAVAHCQTALASWGEFLPLVELGEVAAAVAFVGFGTVRSQRLSQSDGEEESDDGDGLHFCRSRGLMFGGGVRQSNDNADGVAMGRIEKKNETEMISVWKSRPTIKTRLVVADPEDSLARGL